MRFIDFLRPRSSKVVAETVATEVDASELPNMEAAEDDMTVGYAAQAVHANARAAPSLQGAIPVGASRAAEEGLPAVNRNRGGNRMVQVLAVVILLVLGAAFTIGFNRSPKQKTASNGDAISNAMPKLGVPPPAPREASFFNIGGPAGPASAASGAMVSTSGASPSDARAIAVVGGKAASRPAGGEGKPPLEWWDRKRARHGGNLVEHGERLGCARRTPVRSRSSAPAPRARHLLQDHSQLTRRLPARDSLAARLEPSEFKSASATVLADRNFLITKGTALDCALETAIDTTLPGILTCRLSRDVYSDNGQVLLLDRGTQLVGEQAGSVKQGQGRVFALWNRAKTPAGIVISLNSPGTDALGRSGLEGWVDNHFIDRFGAAILMSIIQGAVNRYSSNGQVSGTTVYSGTAAGGGQIVEKILESTINIPPTILKNQGDHIQVMVARDLDFSGVYALKTTP